MTHSRGMMLVSIHDVTPRHESETDEFLDRLKPFVGKKLALLVVPNHWGDCPIIPGSRFATRLREWSDSGHEIFLHGWFHRDATAHEGAINRWRARALTAGEGEFLGLSRAAASARIREGKTLLEDIIGRPVAGFIAPAWLYGDGARQALIDCKIPISEDHFSVWSPLRGVRLARTPVVTWASRARWRANSSMALARMMRNLPLPSVMRVGVHPPDLRSPAILESIEATIAALMKTRRPAHYANLMGTAATK